MATVNTGDRQTIPVELAERFLPAENVAFEVLRTDGEVRLWRSTAKREPLEDGLPRWNFKYHVSTGEALDYLLMRLDAAGAHFELAASRARRRQ